MKAWFIVLFLLFLSLASYAQIVENELIIETNEAKLSGTLVIPEGKTKIPVVLIIAGSGPTDRNGNATKGLSTDAYKLLANDLAKNGIASLRYDKRGVGTSTNQKKYEDIVFNDFIDDALACLGVLKNNKNFKNIYVLGHSEGALVGLESSLKTKVSGYISVAGAGFPIDSVLKWQLAKQPIVYKPSVPMIDSLKAGLRVNAVPPLLKALFAPTVQNFLISWMQIDPRIAIAKLKTPCLILQGTNDIQVATFNAEALKNAQPKAKLVLLEGMNHVLKNAPTDFLSNVQTYNKPELPLHEKLVAVLVDFIKN